MENLHPDLGRCLWVRRLHDCHVGDGLGRRPVAKFPVSANRGLHAETEKQKDISLTWRPLATHGLLFILTEL